MDSHALFADALELTLCIEGYDARTFDLGLAPRSSEIAVVDILRIRPQLVVLDVLLDGTTDAPELIAPLARSGVDTVVLTSSPELVTWSDAVHRGARRVLSKSSPLSQFLAVVHRLHQGLAVMSIEERRALLHRGRELVGDGDETCPEHA